MEQIPGLVRGRRKATGERVVPRWTKDQDVILEEFGNLGAEACRGIIYQQTGVMRTVDATERHAYRIGVSCFQCEICPRCGKHDKKLNEKTGLCRACNELQRAEDQRRLNIRIYREIRNLENGTDYEYKANKRRNAAIRQENSRLCRKHGLPGLRERKRHGEFVDLSESLSKSMSKHQKIL